jgi:hemerythrin superfamily protein
MDLWQAIKQDHRKVDQLFQEIGDGTGDKSQLFLQIKQELTAHTEGEEQAVYPVLRQHTETKDLVQHSLKEHKEVDQLLHQLQQIPKGDSQWAQKLQELKDAVKHHVQEEEQKVIPAAEKVISAEQNGEMLRGFQQAKQSVTV